MCTACIVTWFTTFDCNGVMCPCCNSEEPLVPSLLKPAPPIVFTLLEDIKVHCVACMRDVRAGDYYTHECSAAPTTDEVKVVSQVLTKLADTSPDKTFSIPTGGTVKCYL